MKIITKFICFFWLKLAERDFKNTLTKTELKAYNDIKILLQSSTGNISINMLESLGNVYSLSSGDILWVINNMVVYNSKLKPVLA